MSSVLSYAQQTDSGLTNLTEVLWGALIIGATAIAVCIVVVITRHRIHRHANGVILLAVVWGMVTAGDLLYTQQSQMNWSKEYDLRIRSGYYDPRDASDAPALPWLLWSGLAVCYVTLLMWSLSSRAVRTDLTPSARERPE